MLEGTHEPVSPSDSTLLNIVSTFQIPCQGPASWKSEHHCGVGPTPSPPSTSRWNQAGGVCHSPQQPPPQREDAARQNPQTHQQAVWARTHLFCLLSRPLVSAFEAGIFNVDLKHNEQHTSSRAFHCPPLRCRQALQSRSRGGEERCRGKVYVFGRFGGGIKICVLHGGRGSIHCRACVHSSSKSTLVSVLGK